MTRDEYPFHWLFSRRLDGCFEPREGGLAHAYSHVEVKRVDLSTVDESSVGQRPLAILGMGPRIHLHFVWLRRLHGQDNDPIGAEEHRLTSNFRYTRVEGHGNFYFLACVLLQASDDHIQRLKAGQGVAKLRSDINVVPIAVRGTDERKKVYCTLTLGGSSKDAVPSNLCNPTQDLTSIGILNQKLSAAARYLNMPPHDAVTS